MGKTGWIEPIIRSSFFIRFWGTFVAVLGLVSAVLTIAGKHLSVTSGILSIAGALLVSAVVNRGKRKQEPLSAEQVLGIDIELFAPSRLTCPCDLKLADEAKRLAQSCYPADNSISPERFEQLRLKNPLILACLTGSAGQFLGYFDVVPLKEDFARLFLRGSVGEMQITHQDVLAEDEMHLCRYLFISGLAVCSPKTHPGGRHASILIWGLLKYLDQFYGRAMPLTFALAGTDAGNDLLRRFGLMVECEAEARSDKCKLYSLRISHEEIAKRLDCLPDWSSLCSIDWSQEVVAGAHLRPGIRHPRSAQRHSYNLRLDPRPGRKLKGR
jgi:hypothetical protein